MSTNHQIFNEKLLLSKVSLGYRDAFSLLYRRYLDTVHQYIFLFTKSIEETDEIVQDVFVKLWLQREQLSAVQSFKAYLLRSAKNKLLDHLKHQQVKKNAFQEILQQVNQPSDTPEDVWRYKDLHSKFQEVVSGLPKQCQLVFRMSIENGLSLDEIAQQLQISKSGVKNQLYKAQKYVKEHIEDQFIKTLIIITISYFL